MMPHRPKQSNDEREKLVLKMRGPFLHQSNLKISTVLGKDLQSGYVKKCSEQQIIF